MILPWSKPKKQTHSEIYISIKQQETSMLIWLPLLKKSSLKYNKSLNQVKSTPNLFMSLQFMLTESSSQIQTVLGQKKESKRELLPNKMHKLKLIQLNKEDSKLWKELPNKSKMEWISTWVLEFLLYYLKFFQKTLKSVFKVKTVFSELVLIQLPQTLILI